MSEVAASSLIFPSPRSDLEMEEQQQAEEQQKWVLDWGPEDCVLEPPLYPERSYMYSKILADLKQEGDT